MLDDPTSGSQTSETLKKLAWYAQRKPVYTGGNQVRLLRGGTALFPALSEAIDHARASVWLALYIVSPYGQSNAVLQSLMRAARRGVHVFVVVDGFGSREAPESLWQELEKAGVKLAVYRPMHRLWGLLDASQWRRMHMKLAVIDDAQAFVGGINLIDDHYDLSHGWSDTPRLDYAVQVHGLVTTPVLHTIKAMWTRAQFGRDWRDDLAQLMQHQHKMRRLKRWMQQARMRLNPREQGKLAHGAALHAPMRSAFVLRDNLRQRRTIEQAALQAIHQARQRIDIVTPYFYPRRAIRLALRAAAARGVTVRILLQGKLDFMIAGFAARVLYAELQHHGVRIFEYQPAFLHAKVLCVDDEWATVGSSNLDPLSLVLNLEANLIVKDRQFVRALSAELSVDFAQSQEVRKAGDASPRWITRARRALVRAVAKAYLRLAGVVGRY
ncbi:MAG: cardiolipin synthase ClsB [Burkholderiales bacterium]|jgi:cardiolipin synthase|nr:MAG: cardiolipin synthase ClsB [Burkholderiales bacterium]